MMFDFDKVKALADKFDMGMFADLLAAECHTTAEAETRILRAEVSRMDITIFAQRFWSRRYAN